MFTEFSKFIINEKSSLTKLGIPNEVMKAVQEVYKLPAKTKWIKIDTLKDFKKELIESESSIYIAINNRKVKIITNYNHELYLQMYVYSDVEFGTYTIYPIEKKSPTQLLKMILNSDDIYKSDAINIIPPIAEIIAEDEYKKFDKSTQDFKFDTIKNFNNIISRIYTIKYNDVINIIASNMSNLDNLVSQEEITEFLKNNDELLKISKEYDRIRRSEDYYRLKSIQKQHNSLTLFDEMLIEFEDMYSEFYGVRVTVPQLITLYGYMKVQTAFIYFIYTKRIKPLN